jgi:hypothetical protein
MISQINGGRTAWPERRSESRDGRAPLGGARRSWCGCMRNNLLLSMHGHGKAANRCLGQKRSANLSLSAYMQVGAANETTANGASAPGTCGFEPFVHGLRVVAQPGQVLMCTVGGRPAARGDQCPARRSTVRLPHFRRWIITHPIATTQGRPRHDLWTKLR